MLQQRIISEHNRLMQEAGSIQRQLSSLPDGKLICTTDNGYVKWYQSDGTYYPDFTIRHPKTGDYYYWEHFGIMDDSKYRQRTISKLEHYIENGIIPSIQLITTYETRLHPLSSDTVMANIEQYFL